METKPLSYSSAQLLLNCEQRYWHHKVNETAPDPDFEEDMEAFRVGKTFHEVLELNKHTRENVKGLLKEACVTHDTEHHKLMIYAMLMRYLEVHELSGLTCVLCEQQITSKEVIGFIDAIMVDRHKNWYICDLKTSGFWKEGKVAELPTDYQLNLYSYFAEMMAGVLGLDPTKFKGCLYRVTTKSKLKQGSKESDEAYFKRMYKGIKSLDIFIPKEVMAVNTIWERHLTLFKRAGELFQGEVPERNYSYCMSYFRPCQYWSNCHKDTNTDCLNKAVVNTASTYKKQQKTIMESL